jgi:hypothetical protein
VIRKGMGEGGRNDPNIVCTYELKKKNKKKKRIPRWQLERGSRKHAS